jgi:hypothetical protein
MEDKNVCNPFARFLSNSSHWAGRTSKSNSKNCPSWKATLVYLEGEGGVGKTAILRELQLQAHGICLSHILDMYHLEYQTPYGFAAGLAELLSSQRIPTGEFRASFDAMQQARDSHDSSAKEVHWEKAQQALAHSLNKVSRTTPLWIMLDTVEAVSKPAMFMRSWLGVWSNSMRAVLTA